MLGKKSRRTDAIWRDQVLWIPGKTWWWGPERGFKANFKANDNHCTWRGQIIRIRLLLTSEFAKDRWGFFLTHNQICLKLACCAGWVAPLAFCLSINVPSANTGYLDVSLTSFFNLLALISIFYCYFQASWADCILHYILIVLQKQRHLWILWNNMQQYSSNFCCQQKNIY